MKNLTIVARIVAKKESVELVHEELMKLIEPTRKEEGCLQYDLHRDNNDLSVFVFYENWTSRELWQKHMNNDHLAAYSKATEGAVESFILNEMTLI